MKHKPVITAILLGMFLLTQFVGLYVVNYYSHMKIVNGEIQNVSAPNLPFDMDPPKAEKQADYYGFFSYMVFAFVIAILMFMLFTKFRLDFIIKLWFFFVVIIALSISFYVITSQIGIERLFIKIPVIATLIALPLAFVKVYKKKFLIHNLTEIFVYPGVASIFVPILNIYTIIFLLILISIYDMWAVWKSGIMQKMAKYQINKLNIFSGFFVPYADKKTKQKISLVRERYKSKKISKKEFLEHKFKINVAILGGGDVIFPIISSGVMLKTWGLPSAIFVIVGATLGLGLLFLFSEKKKFYPAMPFISAGIFLGILSSWLIF